MKSALFLLAGVIAAAFAAPTSQVSRDALVARAPVADMVSGFIKRDESTPQDTSLAGAQMDNADHDYFVDNTAACLTSEVATKWLQKLSPEDYNSLSSLGSLGLGPIIRQSFVESSVCFYPFQCIDLDLIFGYGEAYPWRRESEDGIHYINRTSFDSEDISWCKIYKGKTCQTDGNENDVKDLVSTYNADEVPLHDPISMKCGIPCDATTYDACPMFKWDANKNWDSQDPSIKDDIKAITDLFIGEDQDPVCTDESDDCEGSDTTAAPTLTPTPTPAPTRTTYSPLLPSSVMDDDVPEPTGGNDEQDATPTSEVNPADATPTPDEDEDEDEDENDEQDATPTSDVNPAGATPTDDYDMGDDE